MFSHVILGVNNLDVSKKFYDAMLGALGVTSNMADVRGAALASYLLFEQGYTQELMALGRADTLARRADVCRFFGWKDTGAALRTRLPT